MPHGQVNGAESAQDALRFTKGKRMDTKRSTGQTSREQISAPMKATSAQPYQVLLYSRALHPELFQLKARRVHKRGEYELEAWLMNGMHVLRFSHNGSCACELLTDQARSPVSGIVAAFPCLGEREFEHTFEHEGVTFMSTIQTETLNETIYDSTYAEFCALAKQNNALIAKWDDENTTTGGGLSHLSGGKNLSVIDVQEYAEEVHVQCYHMLAGGRHVLRTQTIFEHA